MYYIIVINTITPSTLGTETLAEVPVVVLCGGRATRISELTKNEVPKHLLQVAGRTVLEHCLAPFDKAGDYIFATGVHSDRLEDFIVNAPLRHEVRFSREEEPLGTVRAISKAIKKFRVCGRFILAHGDEITPGLDIGDMLDFHNESGSEITMLATDNQPSIPDFAFNLDDNQIAISFMRGPAIINNSPPSNYGTGTFICEPSVAEKLDVSQDWGDFLMNMIAAGNFHGYASHLPFHNINRPQDMENFAAAIAAVALAS